MLDEDQRNALDLASKAAGSSDLELLIDGRNCVYRALFANRSNQPRRQHSLVVMLRFISKWVNIFMPGSVHVFWDAPKATVWRRRLLSTYKDRDSDYMADVVVELGSVQEAAKAVFTHLNIRQYQRQTMEADDLIYTFCRFNRTKPIMVVSSDSDFVQLLYNFAHVTLYEPQENQLIDRPDYDPVIQKSLSGDNTDCVGGYNGIGPVKSKAMARDPNRRITFLAEQGRQTFFRNMLLIDLGMCPYLMHNMAYVDNVMSKPPTYDKVAAIAAAAEHNVSGFVDEYHKICHPFKTLGGDYCASYACPECGKAQRRSRSGWACENGHGFGEPTLAKNLQTEASSQ